MFIWKLNEWGIVKKRWETKKEKKIILENFILKWLAETEILP